MALNKSNMVDSVQKSTGLDYLTARRAVDHLLDLLGSALGSGERIELRGFGVFTPYITKPKVARNITANEQIIVPPRVKIKFRLTHDSARDAEMNVLAPAV